MEKHINKSQTLYSLSSLFIFVCILLMAGINLYITQSLLNVLVIMFCIGGITIHFIYIHHMKSLLLKLINMTQMIIDQESKEFPIIDGESYISVLSNHLHLLNQRMQGVVEQLNKEKQNLKIYIENISHQMKTPLTALFLKEDILLESTTDMQHQIVEQIIFQTEKIHHCIESLLHLAQLESHTIQYHKKEYLLDELIDSIQQRLLPLMEEHHVSFQLQDTEHIIYCDFQWMSEAIENILKNCIEQKDHSSIDIMCIPETTYTKIKIHDHGKGFLTEDIPHIFERFYRNQYQSNEGIGIGLAITHQIIEDHHGSIHIYNEQGAIFEIVLPHKETKSKYTITNE